MIPRHRFDLRAEDLGEAIRLSLSWRQTGARVERQWAPGTIACLSVRSGFDLLLSALALPRGSQVLVSAVTIPDMIGLLESHGLVPIPVDLDPETLELCPRSLAAARTHETRAILVAHLFGSRISLEPALSLGLPVWEDCAQAFCGPSFTGHPAAQVSMFSFGLIKTSTALGGALMVVRDDRLEAGMRAIESRWPAQPDRELGRRALKVLALQLLGQPVCLDGFVALCRLLGLDYDRVLRQSTRSFPANRLLESIRRRPSPALLEFLARRLAAYDPTRLESRRRFRAAFLASLPPRVCWPGRGANVHHHWVVPVLARERLTTLRQAGFDATQGSSLVVVPSREGAQPAHQAHRMLAETIYLPLHPDLSPTQLSRLRQSLLA
ncbi:MAG: hypothetical protein AMXMBFR33_15910 [Candidatus Xenobia bacterium]